MVGQAARETALVPYHEQKVVLLGIVADGDDFIKVSKGAWPRILGYMPVVPGPTTRVVGKATSMRR